MALALPIQCSFLLLCAIITSGTLPYYFCMLLMENLLYSSLLTGCPTSGSSLLYYVFYISPFTLFLLPSGRRPSNCCPLHSWLTLINVGINLPLTLRRSCYSLSLPATSLLIYDLAGSRGGTSPIGKGLGTHGQATPLFYFPS